MGKVIFYIEAFLDCMFDHQKFFIGKYLVIHSHFFSLQRQSLLQSLALQAKGCPQRSGHNPNLLEHSYTVQLKPFSAIPIENRCNSLQRKFYPFSPFFPHYMAFQLKNFSSIKSAQIPLRLKGAGTTSNCLLTSKSNTHINQLS